MTPTYLVNQRVRWLFAGSARDLAAVHGQVEVDKAFRGLALHPDW